MDFDLGRFDPATFSGIPDDAVKHFASPPYGFVRSWMEYMYPCTDAPLIYHVGVALSILSTLVPPSVMLPDGDELPANLFTLLVGPSVFSRKTYTIKQGRLALTKVAPHALMSDDGSGEGFADAILINPRRLIVSEEGGMFFQHTMSGNYASSLRSRLMALADATPLERHTSKRGGKGGAGSVDVKREEHPRVCMLIGCTRAHLEEHTFKLDWEGGFLSRYLTFWATRSRTLEEPVLDPDGRLRMESYLAAFAQITSCGPCVGMTDEARAYYRTWQRKLTGYATTRSIPEEALGVVERAQQHVRKVALLLAYDRHISLTAQDSSNMSQARETPFAVDIDDVRVGCALGWFHVASVLHVRLNISDNPEGQLMRRIRNFIAESPTGMRSYAEILRKVDRRQKVTSEYLDTLISSEVLARNNTATDVFFWLKNQRNAPSQEELLNHASLVEGTRGTKH